MCRTGGRRCNNVHTTYGRAKQNLKAQEQYTKRKLNQPDLTPEREKKLLNRLNETQNKLESLEQKYEKYSAGKHYRMGLSDKTVKVLDQLKTDGLTPYIVGGSVRDALLGLDNKDIDIEVYGGQVSDVVSSLRKLGKVDEVGKAFGVLKLQLEGEDFDVSLPRKDSLTGEGHRGFDVEVDGNMSLVEATSRRDFTINALMYDHSLEYVVDLHGGLEDLHNRELKHISDAFDEDPLRVLRGVQMASRFGFTLHPDTVTKSKTLKKGFHNLSTERVQIEFQKLYTKGVYASVGLQVLKNTEWDENFPGLQEANTPILWGKVDKAQQLIEKTPTLQNKKEVLLSAVIANSIRNVDNRTKFLGLTTVGDRHKNEALALTTVSSPVVSRAGLRHWAYGAPRGVSLESWCVVQEAEGADVTQVKMLAEELGVWRDREQDLVNGDDVLGLTDTQPGRWVRNVLSAVREAQYNDAFTDRAGALQWVKNSGLVP